MFHINLAYTLCLRFECFIHANFTNTLLRFECVASTTPPPPSIVVHFATQIFSSFIGMDRYSKNTFFLNILDVHVIDLGVVWVLAKGDVDWQHLEYASKLCV